MSIKHTVSCACCQAEAEARPIHDPNATVRWNPPYEWLSIHYNLVGPNGAYRVLEDRHACPNCAQDVLDALAEATGQDALEAKAAGQDALEATTQGQSEL